MMQTELWLSLALRVKCYPRESKVVQFSKIWLRVSSQHFGMPWTVVNLNLKFEADSSLHVDL